MVIFGDGDTPSDGDWIPVPQEDPPGPAPVFFEFPMANFHLDNVSKSGIRKGIFLSDMGKVMRQLGIPTILLMLFTVFNPGISSGQTENLHIALDSTPPFDQVVPVLKGTRLTVRVLDENDHPVPNVILYMALNSPDRSPIFSTDFPVVEGTHLWEFTTLSKTGEWDLEYLFPIRGKYNLLVSAKPLSAGEGGGTVSKTFEIEIHENPKEVRNLAVFLTVLFLFGLVSGLVLCKSRIRKGRNA